MPTELTHGTMPTGRRSLPLATLVTLVTLGAVGLVGLAIRRQPPPQDRHTFGAVPDDRGQEAERKRLAPESLLPIDDTMFSLSAATGGDFYFWSPGEFGTRPLELPLPGESIVLTYDTLGPEEIELTWPMDGLAGCLDVFVGAQRLDHAELLRPSGAPVVESDADARLQRFDRMRLVRIDQPAAGTWTLRVAGRGQACLSARSARGQGLPFADPNLEPIELLDFDFVALGGRPAHEGYFRVASPPRPGESHHLQVALAGSVRDAQLRLVDERGRVLEEVHSVQSDARPGDSLRSLLGRCTIPSVPFRIEVRGEDVTGAAYRRLFATSVDPFAPLLPPHR